MLKPTHAMMKSLLKKKIDGVKKGFLVYLRIHGIG